MKRLLACVVWLIVAQIQAVEAQDFSIPAARLPVGTIIPVAFSVPEMDPQPIFDIGVTKVGSEVISPKHQIHGAEEGQFEMALPADPGIYEITMQIRNGRVVRRKSVVLFFAPTPGALTLSTERATIGQEIIASVRLHEGQYVNGAWVGMFTTGDTSDGGASIADNRNTWQWAPAGGGDLVFRLPPWTGIYEFRLFDRQTGPYVIDQKRVEVFADPAPGMLALDQQVYEVGAPIQVSATLDRDRYFHSAWVGMFAPSISLDGGVEQEEYRLTWQWLNKEQMMAQFAAPNRAGTYEFRIFDREGASAFELDRISFEVKASLQPDAIGLKYDSFVVGEKISIPITLEPNRFYASPWLGLFETAAAPVAGNARRSIRRLTWNWVATDQAVELIAPSQPGIYEVRLFDREHLPYEIDTFEITVTVPPTPGAISLNKSRYEIGEPIVITTKLESGRFYASPWIGIYDHGPEQIAGGVKIARSQLSRAWVADGQPTTLPAVNHPGTYRVRLYDRETAGFILDGTEFEVVATPTSGTVTTDKDTYRVGENITINVDIPQPRFTSSPWVGLLLDQSNDNDENAKVIQTVFARDWIVVDGGPYTLKAHTNQGTYRVVAFDREHNGRTILGEKTIHIVSEPENLLRISGRQFAPGETVKIQTRWPEGLDLFSPKVSVVKSSYITAGGGLAVEIPIRSHNVARGSQVFEFPAPIESGQYEVRFHDRQQHFYIMDIEEFTVRDPKIAMSERSPFRLTPLPGDGKGTPPFHRSSPERPEFPADETSEDNPSSTSDDPESVETEPDETTDPEVTENPTDETPENPDVGPPVISIVAVGPNGFVNINEIVPGQSFIVEARFATSPNQPTLNAQIILGEGEAIDVVMKPDGEEGLYRSYVIRMPSGGEQ